MNDPQHQVFVRASQGDATALDDLVRANYSLIYAFLHRLCGNPHDAADLTQKTFCRFVERLERFSGRSTVSTWLHGISYHVYLEWRRASGRTEAKSSAWWEDCVDQDPGPFRHALERDQARRLYEQVERLEEGVRAVVHLHYYQDLSIAETAEALGIGTNTVKYRLRAALKALQNLLRESGRPAPARNHHE